MFWDKTIHYFTHQLLLQQCLDGREQANLIGTDQGDCHTGKTCPASPADTVDIVFCNLWQIKIKDMRKLTDIDTT